MTSAIRRSALALTTGLLLTISAARAEATVPGALGRGGVVFDSRSGGDADVFMRSHDGSAELALPANVAGADDSRPAWAPEPLLEISTVSPEGAGLRIEGNGFATPDYFVAGGARAAPGIASITLDGLPVDPAAIRVESDQALVITSLPGGTSAASALCVRKRAGMAVAESFTVTSVPFDSATAPDPLDGCPTQPIAFQSNRTGDYEIYLYDPALPVAAGVNPVNVSRSPGSHDTAPAWSSSDPGVGFGDFPSVLPSPLLAYVSDRDGNRNVYVLDPALPLSGDNPAPLTTDPADDANPDWAGDGRGIVFQSTRAGLADVWSMDVVRQGLRFVPESGLRQVTADEQPAYDPVWYTDPESADSDPGRADAIAFAGPEDTMGGACQLQLIKWPSGPPPIAATGQETSDGHADEPAFLPYGDAITVTSMQGGVQTDLWSYPTPQQPEDPLPAWSPRIVRPGAEGHPNWQAMPWPAVVYFNQPKGRASRRKKRRPPSGALAASAQTATARPCAAPPEAAFTSEPARPVASRRAVLDAGASADGTGPIALYEWDIDRDGTYEGRSGSPRLTHTFRGAGPHIVGLRVVDQDGESATVTRTITVVTTQRLRARCAAAGAPGMNVVAGTARRDRLRGTRRRDIICGFGGNDVIRGLGAGDRLLGQAGADRIIGGRGDDRMAGGQGADRMAGGRGADRMAGGPGGDRLNGGRGRDRMTGGKGRDGLRARDGRRDRVRGGAGRDRTRADARDDVAGVERVRRS